MFTSQSLDRLGCSLYDMASITLSRDNLSMLLTTTIPNLFVKLLPRTACINLGNLKTFLVEKVLIHTPHQTSHQRVHKFTEVYIIKFVDNDIVTIIRECAYIGFEVTRPHFGFQVCECTEGGLVH